MIPLRVHTIVISTQVILKKSILWAPFTFAFAAPWLGIFLNVIFISPQHDETVTNEQIRADLMEQVIKPVVPAQVTLIF